MISKTYLSLYYIHPEMFELLYRTALKDSSDIVICDFEYAYENSIFNYVCDINIKSEVFNNLEALNQLYSSRGLQFLLATNKLYKKELFDGLRYLEGKINEDQFIAHEILYKSKKTSYLPIKLYFYMQSDGSIMRSKFSIKRLDDVYALSKRVDFFKNKKMKNLQYKAEYQYINAFFLNYYKAKTELDGVDKELKILKHEFNKKITFLLKNPFYNNKEKFMWILFILNTSIYERYALAKNMH